MNIDSIYRAVMRKRATAVLTPEAEQAAVQGEMQPQMGAGMPPQDPSMMAGAGAGPTGPNGGQIPPEIVQDQMFMEFLASQGIQFDPQSMQFIGPDGQPVPADIIMQAYQMYQQEMAAQQGGAGMAPQDPSMMQQGMPPQAPAAAPAPAPEGGMPAEGAMPPQAPGMDAGMGAGMPLQGAEQPIPPEVTQDQLFMQFMQEALGAQLDPNTGGFIDAASGQPIPNSAVMEAYQAFQQQVQSMQQGGGAMPPQGPGMMPQDQGQEMPQQMGAGGDILQEVQKIVDASIQAYTAEIDKKIETLIDKLDTVKMAIEEIRGTDDGRSGEDKLASKAEQDAIAADLAPQPKTASVQPQKRTKKGPAPLNMFSYILNKDAK